MRILRQRFCQDNASPFAGPLRTKVRSGCAAQTGILGRCQLKAFMRDVHQVTNLSKHRRQFLVTSRAHLRHVRIARSQYLCLPNSFTTDPGSQITKPPLDPGFDSNFQRTSWREQTEHEQLHKPDGRETENRSISERKQENSAAI